MSTAVPRRIILFGASGDLASRYFLPAVVRLHQHGRLTEKLRIQGIARQQWTDDQFRAHLLRRLESNKIDLDREAVRTVLSRFSYAAADLTKGDEVVRAVGRVNEPVLVYLAVPPALFHPAIEALSRAHLPPESRLILEKPFGEDLPSARELNRRLHEHFPESAVFRVDHFLGKQTVQNVLGLRFANRLFEPLWGHGHVEEVRIVWEEREGLEGRAGYYDKTGALKDMIQNHLMQLLCLIAMEAPQRFREREFRDRKISLLRAVRSLDPHEVARHTVRARYGSGTIQDRTLPAYREEKGVDPERCTETFAQVTLWVDNERWSGVPFVLRTGKALARERQEITVRFRPVSETPFTGQRHAQNVVRLSLNPDQVSLRVNLNGPGSPRDLEQVDLQATLAPEPIPAYGHLLLEALEGDSTLFVRDDEAEESWRIVDPVTRVWRQGGVTLAEYPAGSQGP